MERYMLNCFACSREFPYGPHIYGGTHIPSYGITVCTMCYAHNGDGWNPDAGRKILKHLQDRGLPIPAHNESGCLPRDG